MSRTSASPAAAIGSPSGSRSGYSSETRRPFVLLKPVKISRPDLKPADLILRGRTGAQQAIALINRINNAKVPAAIDLETRGTRPERPETAVVGIGIATRFKDGSRAVVYIDYPSLDEYHQSLLISAIVNARGVWVAHNQLFDGMMLTREARRFNMFAPEFLACTFGMYHQLASEGWKGQTWGLKDAQVNLLGWPESNEKERDLWLVRNGYITKGPKQKKGTKKRPPETREEWLARVLVAYEQRKVSPDLSEMWRVPADIMSIYCALDCISTLQLYESVLLPAMRRFPELATFHSGPFLSENRMLIQQVIDGLRVNEAGFRDYAKDIEARITALVAQLRVHPSTTLFISEFETAKLAAAIKLEPARHRAFRRKEPKQYNKDGVVSRGWETWRRLREEHEANPPVTKGWDAWVRRREMLTTTPKGREKWVFNFSSPKHLRALIFRDGGPIGWRESGQDGMNGHPTVEFAVPVPDSTEVRWVEADRTKSGSLPTGKKAMQQWGELGKLLLKYREEVKELGYVNEWLDKIVYDAKGQARVHCGWISPGTVTLRLVGKAPNLQQAPKSIKFMENILPDDGTIWVECDHASVEPTVLCELTRDPVLMSLYGPGAPPDQCVYLFNGADLPIIGPKIRATGYDPLNPTKESVARAKKDAKKERTIAKPIVLGKNYGMGWRKMQSELRLQCGLFLTDDEAKAIDAAWKKKYIVSGKLFSRKLEEEWKRNGGWVYDGLGHPVCVNEDYLKDIISRVVQRCAHSIHMIFALIVDRLMTERKLQHRWRVVDWHDQLIAQVPTANGEAGLQCVRDAYKELNEEILQGLIPIKGDPKISTNMAHAKEAEE